jgi:hypothetical protein
VCRLMNSCDEGMNRACAEHEARLITSQILARTWSRPLKADYVESEAPTIAQLAGEHYQRKVRKDCVRTAWLTSNASSRSTCSRTSATSSSARSRCSSSASSPATVVFDAARRPRVAAAAAPCAWFVIDAVAEMDLEAFYAAYRVDGRSRPPYDPAMMVALLLYA